MKQKNETANKKLFDYLDSLPTSVSKESTIKIIDACKICQRKFYNWKHANTRIEPLYQDKIEEVLGKQIFS